MRALSTDFMPRGSENVNTVQSKDHPSGFCKIVGIVVPRNISPPGEALGILYYECSLCDEVLFRGDENRDAQTLALTFGLHNRDVHGYDPDAQINVAYQVRIDPKLLAQKYHGTHLDWFPLDDGEM